MGKYLAKSWWSVVIFAVGLFLVRALFHSGFYSMHDGIFHIYRTEEALNMLKMGQFPLRWAGNFDQGFGIPLFTFIYPLPYYLTALISYLTSSIIAVKTITLVAYLAGGLGIFQLFRKSIPPLAFTLALLYLMTPYQFLNIFVRGALGEVLALGIMPWVLYSFKSLVESDGKLSWYHPIALGLLLLSHNFLGILFTIFLLGYLIFQKKSGVGVAKSLLLSFGLAAFFLVPMIVQKNFLYSAQHPDLNFRYDQHFVTLRQLLYSKWDYWYSLPGDQDGMSFQIGVVQLTLALLGVIYTLFNRQRSRQELYLVLAFFGSVFLMHARSYPIWNAIPILQSIQFPWRFLFMPTILTPLLAFPLLKSLAKKQFFPYLIIALVALSYANIRNYRRPIKYLDTTEYTNLYLLYLNKTSTTFRTEILPKWGVEQEQYKTDELLVNSGNMIIDSLVTTPVSVETTINNKPDSAPAVVTIARNYYPGWIGRMDGKTKVTLTPTPDGMISLSPEIGVHTYLLTVESTVVERIANVISLITIILIGVLWRKNQHQKQ